MFINSYEIIPAPTPAPGIGPGGVGPVKLPVIVTFPVPEDKIFVQIPVPIAVAKIVLFFPFAPMDCSCESMLELIRDDTTAMLPTVIVPDPRKTGVSVVAKAAALPKWETVASMMACIIFPALSPVVGIKPIAVLCIVDEDSPVIPVPIPAPIPGISPVSAVTNAFPTMDITIPAETASQNFCKLAPLAPTLWKLDSMSAESADGDRAIIPP